MQAGLSAAHTLKSLVSSDDAAGQLVTDQHGLLVLLAHLAYPHHAAAMLAPAAAGAGAPAAEKGVGAGQRAAAGGLALQVQMAAASTLAALSHHHTLRCALSAAGSLGVSVQLSRARRCGERRRWDALKARWTLHIARWGVQGGARAAAVAAPLPRRHGHAGAPAAVAARAGRGPRRPYGDCLPSGARGVLCSAHTG